MSPRFANRNREPLSWVPPPPESLGWKKKKQEGRGPVCVPSVSGAAHRPAFVGLRTWEIHPLPAAPGSALIEHPRRCAPERPRPRGWGGGFTGQHRNEGDGGGLSKPAEPLLEGLRCKGPADPPVVPICEMGCPSCAQASGTGCQKDKRRRR